MRQTVPPHIPGVSHVMSHYRCSRIVVSKLEWVFLFWFFWPPFSTFLWLRNFRRSATSVSDLLHMVFSCVWNIDARSCSFVIQSLDLLFTTASHQLTSNGRPDARSPWQLMVRGMRPFPIPTGGTGMPRILIGGCLRVPRAMCLARFMIKRGRATVANDV
jgi:hypothetical protein